MANPTENLKLKCQKVYRRSREDGNGAGIIFVSREENGGGTRARIWSSAAAYWRLASIQCGQNRCRAARGSQRMPAFKVARSLQSRLR